MFRRGQQRCLGFSDAGKTSRHLEIPDHDCQWFGRSILTLPKGGDGLFGTGINGQMKTAQTFDCHHLTSGKGTACQFQAVAGHRLPFRIVPA